MYKNFPLVHQNQVARNDYYSYYIIIVFKGSIPIKTWCPCVQLINDYHHIKGNISPILKDHIVQTRDFLFYKTINDVIAISLEIVFVVCLNRPKGNTITKWNWSMKTMHLSHVIPLNCLDESVCNMCNVWVQISFNHLRVSWVFLVTIIAPFFYVELSTDWDYLLVQVLDYLLKIYLVLHKKKDF